MNGEGISEDYLLAIGSFQSTKTEKIFRSNSLPQYRQSVSEKPNKKLRGSVEKPSVLTILGVAKLTTHASVSGCVVQI
ncbi:hypothetical protein U1Q18_033298 [Sarracenia purpurea var. burkii]